MASGDRACLVLGGATHSTLAAVRSIARTGVPTYAGTLDRRSVAVFASSRSCAGARRILGTDPESLAAELVAFADEAFAAATDVLVITTSERLMDHLDGARAILDPRFTVAIPSPELCGALLDKARSLALAEEAGLQVPRWTAVASPADIDQMPSWRYPVCVRPTAWSTTGSTSFKIEVCADEAALRACLDAAVGGGGAFIVQEYVGDADGLDVGMIWVAPDGGERRTWTGRKRRSSAASGGVLAWGETVALPDVDAGIRAFAEATGFTGIGGIEFLRVGRDLWFIEFNPRLEAFHRLGAISGFDAPALAARAWAGQPLPPDAPLPSSAAMWVGGAWVDRLARDPLGLVHWVADGVRFAAHRRRTWSVWELGDPRPALVLIRIRIRRRLEKVLAARRRR